jgi:hypothetical protein
MQIENSDYQIVSEIEDDEEFGDKPYFLTIQIHNIISVVLQEPTRDLGCCFLQAIESAHLFDWFPELLFQLFQMVESNLRKEHSYSLFPISEFNHLQWMSSSLSKTRQFDCHPI